MDQYQARHLNDEIIICYVLIAQQGRWNVRFLFTDILAIEED